MNPQHNSPSPAPHPARRVRLGRLGFVAALLIAAAFVAGLLPRLRARQIVATETRELATPTVSVVSPAPGRREDTIALPAEVKPLVEAPIYARASGYLKRWLVDIGANVKAGQLLAEIDTPELDQDLARARAELARAEAGLALAQTTAARWTELLKTASVSEQETAEKKADLALKVAAVEAERANLHRLENLKGFARVVAPFDGTITARKTDTGQLITAGGSHELFQLAQTRTLRVFVSVPQTLVRAVAPGQSAEVTFPELPGRKFQAKVVRTAGAVDADSRTLLTELSLDNARGELLAGSYAQVRFIEARSTTALTLPSNALLFRGEGMQVGLVSPDGKVALRNIKLGRDFGKAVEVIEGLTPTDRVILNPSDSLTAGATVRVSGPSQTAATR
ncbi:MAG: efflux RND transporter periplasmic adaptor subunit [Verrucomicrobia bacterium]|nr:efflux RND transporter periplasmic adaptor subunit [Verrucomicrobiota bacterium]